MTDFVRRGVNDFCYEPMKINIRAERHKVIPKQYVKKWTNKLAPVMSDSEAITILFLGEILETVNCQEALFESFGEVKYDMFGGCDFSWKLTSGNLMIQRIQQKEISDGWQRLEVTVDKVIFSGLEKHGFFWNGECGNGLSTLEIGLNLKNINEIENIEKIGNELFEIIQLKIIE